MARFERKYDYYTCKKCDASIRIPVKFQYEGDVTCPICKSVLSRHWINRKEMYVGLFKEGKTVDEIAEIMAVKPLTVRNKLLDYYVYDAQDIDISKFIVHPEYTDKINEIIDKQRIVPRLREIKGELEKQNIECDYDTIAVVKAFYLVEHRLDDRERKGESI